MDQASKHRMKSEPCRYVTGHGVNSPTKNKKSKDENLHVLQIFLILSVCLSLSCCLSFGQFIQYFPIEQLPTVCLS